MSETVNVVFKSKTRFRACRCDACRNIGEIIMLQLPCTMYHDRKTLSTRYYNYWLCPACRNKLTYALGYSEKGD